MTEPREERVSSKTVSDGVMLVRRLLVTLGRSVWWRLRTQGSNKKEEKVRVNRCG